jgi:spore maturation protein CgeB
MACFCWFISFPNLIFMALQISAVLDTFSHSCFAPECNIRQLKPSSFFEDDYSSLSPDMLFVESAWFGDAGLWHRKISTASAELTELVNHYRQKSIPTVFWCKEDPVHFHRFLATAALFDFVFTTDVGSIPLYKQMLRHTRVYLLPFACQPLLHNPVEQTMRLNAACFAGSYYVRYPQRARDLEAVVDGVSAVCPVAIYDRYYNSPDTNYHFPIKYQSLIKGSLPPEQIDLAYKGYVYGININTVKKSGSMFARRVFELLGSGTVTVSNDSLGIRQFFGELVVASDDRAEIEGRMAQLAINPLLRGKLALAGLRKVLMEHTYAHRLARIQQIVLGMDVEPLLPNMTILAKADNVDDAGILFNIISKQTFTQFKLLLVVPDSLVQDILNSFVLLDMVDVISVSEAEHLKLSNCPDISEWVAGILSVDYYGPNYLLDLVLALRYSKLKAFGKSAFFIAKSNGPELMYQDAVYRPTSSFELRSSIFSLDIVGNMLVSEWIKLLHSDHAIDVEKGGLSLDCYNYCRDGMNGSINLDEITRMVDDHKIDSGTTINAIYNKADTSRMGLPKWVGKPVFRINKLADVFKNLNTSDPIHGTLDQFGWHLVSEIPDGNYAVVWAEESVPLYEFGGLNELKFHVIEGPGLPVSLLVRFESINGRPLGDVEFGTNENQSWCPPSGATHVLFGWRVFSSGTTRIMKFVLDWL